MIINGECLPLLQALGENSIDSIVTDPPYGISFMGKRWDYDVPAVEVWAECLRVLKPGGYLLSFGGTRTYHRLATRIEDAGFVLHPMMGWLFGSGFPKATRVDLPEMDGYRYGLQSLKPAMEPIAMAQKPFSEKTGTANIARWGTGAINIEACRVSGGPVPVFHTSGGAKFEQTRTQPDRTTKRVGFTDAGRWPANVIHDGSDEVLAVFPDAPGQQGDLRATGKDRLSIGRFGDMPPPHEHAARDDSGSAARFFYCAKPSSAERHAGMEHPGKLFKTGSTLHDAEALGAHSGNDHPTVKPIALMRYLCRLVTPRGGLVLDPYTGSGSTLCAGILEGFRVMGFEREAAFVEIARARTAAMQPGLGL